MSPELMKKCILHNRLELLNCPLGGVAAGITFLASTSCLPSIFDHAGIGSVGSYDPRQSSAGIPDVDGVNEVPAVSGADRFAFLLVESGALLAYFIKRPLDAFPKVGSEAKKRARNFNRTSDEKTFTHPYTSSGAI
jgi:hypothetical protein